MPKKISSAVWLVMQELKNKLLLALDGAPQGKGLLLAVSGGADSLALADAAVLLREELGLVLKVCHVEHGIRGQEALEDAALVEAFCRERQLEYSCCHVKAAEYCRQQGCSLEEGARQLRYEALAQEAQAMGTCRVVTAHHRDDQVETFFLRLLRGAGTEGLRGMGLVRERAGLLLLRPLLELPRAALEEYCQDRNIAFCQDSTNQDCHYTRNRIRLELLPQLEREYNPRIREAITGTMEQLEEQENFLLAEECRCWAQLQDIDSKESISWSIKVLQEIPSIIRKRLYRRAYFALGGKELSRERTLALENLLLAGVGGKIIQLPQNIIVSLNKGKFIFLKNKGE